MEKLMLKMVILVFGLILMREAESEVKAKYGNLLSIQYKDKFGNVLFVKWAVYLKDKDVFRFDDCKSLEMKNIKDRFDVHDFAMKDDDLNKCIKELKHKCDPLSDVKPCWPLHKYFNEEDDKQEAENPLEKLEFGDLIAFHHFTKRGVLRYIHWAVFVGKGKVKGLEGLKEDYQDIFHIFSNKLGKPKLSDCQFGIMGSVKGKWKKNNYLDGREDWKALSKEEIIDNMVSLHKKCKWWDPFRNNCEHIATLVRYGKKSFEQPGALASWFSKLKLPTFRLPKGKRSFIPV